MNPPTWLSSLRPNALRLWRRCRRRFHPLLERARAKLWLFASIAVIVAILWGINRYGDWIVTVLWVWLGDTPDGNNESNSATVRNVGLVIAAAFALLFATWRSVVGWRQADTAQRSLLNERYQKGAEMLGSRVLSVRLGGVYALRRLAEEHPKQYHSQVMRLFCAFVRNPTDGNEDQRTLTEEAPPHKVPPLPEDVQAAVYAIGHRSMEYLDLEEVATFRLDLRGSDLRGAQLSDMNLNTPTWPSWAKPRISEWLNRHTDLSGARLCSARLDWTELTEADLTESCLCYAWLMRTDLSGSDLADTNLHGAHLMGTNLSGAKLSRNGERPAQGITQSDLDLCLSDPNNPPDLTGVTDADTGEALVWRGDPLDAKS